MASKKSSAEVDIVEEPANTIVPQTMHSRQDQALKITDLAGLRNLIGQDVAWSEIEPSFDVLNQEAFEDLPLIIGGFRLNESKQYAKPNPLNPKVLIPAEFVSMLVAAYDPDSETLTTPWVIVNDGSTGIKGQLLRFVSTKAGETSDDMGIIELNRFAAEIPPIRCEKGFRRSDYVKELPDGSVASATTWYIA
jgi:hypothetical protein